MTIKKLPYERQSEILELLKKNEFMDIAQLSDMFNVSYMTIHRDLEELAKVGKAARVYGGARISENGLEKNDSGKNGRFIYDLTIEERFKKEQVKKRKIAEKAASMIGEGDIIGIDASTTTLHMCEFISDMRIMVVTNSIAVALQLSSSTKVEVLVLGGTLRKSALTLLGPSVEDNLKWICLDKCFVSASALGAPYGLMDISQEEPEAKRKMIERSNLTYALVDSSKVGEKAPFIVCSVKDLSAMITNSAEDLHEKQKKCLRTLQDQGLNIIYTERKGLAAKSGWR